MNQRDELSQPPTREPPAPVSGNAFVHILACSDGAVHIGSAGDVAKRLAEHGGPKGAKFIRDYPGGRLIYVEGPLSITLALQRERQLKRWSRANKLALIRNQTVLLKKLGHSTGLLIRDQGCGKSPRETKAWTRILSELLTDPLTDPFCLSEIRDGASRYVKAIWFHLTQGVARHMVES